MGIKGVVFDPEADPGLKFPSSVVRDEIGELAPIYIEEASVTESKIGARAVTRPKIAVGAVGPTEIATGGVERSNLAAACVGPTQLDAGAVTGDKAGVGIMTAVNNSGDPIALTAVVLTAAEYAGVSVPDTNTIYFVT